MHHLPHVLTVIFDWKILELGPCPLTPLGLRSLFLLHYNTSLSLLGILQLASFGLPNNFVYENFVLNGFMITCSIMPMASE